VGLKINAEKTESLIMNGGKVCMGMSSHAYQRCITGIGKSHHVILKEMSTCKLCGSQVSNKNIKRHQMTKTCELGRKSYVPPVPTETETVATIQGALDEPLHII
jgi:hypothetical protein